MSYKENSKYKYWNTIRKQCNEFWYFDQSLTYEERKYFFDLKMEALREMNKISNYGE